MSCTSNKKNEAPKVQRQMTIDEILSMSPGKAQMIAQVLTKAGLHCVGCQAATYETLEVGGKRHGFSDEQIDALEEAINQILAQEIDISTISLTPKAAEKYLAILEEENKQGWGIRLTETPAGCNGFKSLIDYSEKAEADDEIFESQGIQIHVKQGLIKRMLGSEIDYIDGGIYESGFTISNPNAKSSCGCGSSYGY